MAGIDLYNDKWRDLVFKGRNRNYGAFELRRDYNRRVMIAIIIGIISVVIFTLIPIIVSAIKASGTNTNVEVDMETELANVEIDQPEEVPPPPDLPPPPAAVKEVKFTPPKIVEQEEIREEDIPPPASTVKKDVILGDETKEGLSKFEVPIDAPEDGTGEKVVGAVIDNKVYSYAGIQKKPTYPGGYLNYFKEHWEMPRAAQVSGIGGTVTVRFTIERDGRITNVKVVSGQELGGGLPEAVLEVIQNMPNWTPGEQNGQKVRVSFQWPITIRIN